MNSPPRVSIGLPVYNGERFLGEALESILAQTYEDFELIISDNASTDGTREMGRAYAAKDRRIRYVRNETNLGAAWNFNRAFELASGEYFKWAAHDDICAPDFLLRCVEKLDEDASVVLSYPRTTHIDERGNLSRNYDIRLNIDSPYPHERFRDLILVNHWCFQVFGVIRASALRTTPLIGNYTASDRVLLATLGLLGRFYEVPQYLFLRRSHSGQLTAVPKQYLHLHAGWYDPRKKGRVTLPEWRLFFEYLAAVQCTPLNRPERVKCYQQMVRWLREHRRKMQADVVRAAKQSLMPYYRRVAQEELLSDSLRETH